MYSIKKSRPKMVIVCPCFEPLNTLISRQNVEKQNCTSEDIRNPEFRSIACSREAYIDDAIHL